MLRITLVSMSDTEPNLRLEGRLVGPWVSELQVAVAELSARKAAVRLDLSGVHFVDAPGLALLQTLQGEGAVLLRVTPFVAELLRARPE